MLSYRNRYVLYVLFVYVCKIYVIWQRICIYGPYNHIMFLYITILDADDLEITI